jgi:ATP sulfurylase
MAYCPECGNVSFFDPCEHCVTEDVSYSEDYLTELLATDGGEIPVEDEDN